MPHTPTTTTATTTSVAGGVAGSFSAEYSASSSSTSTEVITEQIETVTITEVHESSSSSGSASYSASSSSSTAGGATVVTSSSSETHESFDLEAHGGASSSSSSTATTIAQGSATTVSGGAHGSAITVVDGSATHTATTVVDGAVTSHTSTTVSGGGVIGGGSSSSSHTAVTGGEQCKPTPTATPTPTPTPAPPAVKPHTEPTPAPPAKPHTEPTPAPPAKPVDTEHVQKKIRDGRLGAHGVNLGGWLVAEQWMSSSADMWKDVQQGFEGEYQVLVHGSDRETRLANFEKHHATYITEQDIAAIAKAGFNMVRVPVGWWILNEDHDDPGNKSEMEAFPKNTVQYVDKLIREWAVRHNIAVLVDIHAAKGSQNGDQHSAPTVNGQAFWGKYPENVRNTVLLAKSLGDRYKNDVAFLGLGLLNEPAADTDEKVLAQYHQDAYHAVRESGNDCIVSCMPYRYKQEPDNLVGFMEAPAFKNVWIEWHPYFIWGNENKSGDELINKTILTEFQDKVTKWTTRSGANKLFISEWSLANTGQFRDPDSPDFAAWARAQIKVMNQAQAGWCYWSWKIDGDEKEGAFEAWSARSVLHREPLRQILLTPQ